MRPVALTLPAAVRRAILAHAERDAPRECCGLLIGRSGRVLHAAAMRNISASPRVRFRIDPREHIVLRRELRRLSPALEIVGVYHSHPAGPAEPSAVTSFACEPTESRDDPHEPREKVWN